MRELTPYVSAWHQFGAELRDLRRLRNISQMDLGTRIVHSGSTVSKIEKTERWPSREFAIRVDEELGADGFLLQLWEKADTERGSMRDDPIPPGKDEVRSRLLDTISDLLHTNVVAAGPDADSCGRATIAGAVDVLVEIIAENQFSQSDIDHCPID